MAATDLISFASVQDYLRGTIPVPAMDETLIGSLITSVSEDFVSLTGRKIISGSVTESISGKGGTTILLTQYPVTSVTSVSVDGATVPQRTTATGSGWVLVDAEIGRLELVGYEAAQGVANISVVYAAGFGTVANGTIPKDITQGLVDQVCYLYRAKDRIGITNESKDGASVTYLGGWIAQQGRAGQTPLYSSLVERYRRAG